MTGKELANLLKQNEWVLNRINGSHHIFVKKNKRSIPIPIHGSKDLPKGLVRAI